MTDSDELETFLNAQESEHMLTGYIYAAWRSRSASNLMFSLPRAASALESKKYSLTH